MSISIKNLASLVDQVVLPFEHFIMEDPRLADYLASPDVAKMHNMAISKLTVYIYSDIKRAYEYVAAGEKGHRAKHIPIENLKEFYSLYFVLCKEWNEKHMESNDRFGQNIDKIEQFVYESFAKEGESKEEFFIYGSEALKQDLAKMHYREEEKITADEFYAEGSMDEHDRHDIIECCHTLSHVVHESHIEYNQSYFTNVNEHFRAYSIVLEKNLEFRDLGFSLAKLSDFLESQMYVLSEHPKKKMILVLLHALVEDLISWTQCVLIERTAIDIHYLDASLLSSTIQFEMMFNPSPVEEEEELEFF